VLFGLFCFTENFTACGLGWKDNIACFLFVYVIFSEKSILIRPPKDFTACDCRRVTNSVDDSCAASTEQKFIMRSRVGGFACKTTVHSSKSFILGIVSKMVLSLANIPYRCYLIQSKRISQSHIFCSAHMNV
jgi:hypothetical protein